MKKCVGGCGYSGKCACGTGMEMKKRKKHRHGPYRYCRCGELPDFCEMGCRKFYFCRCGKVQP